MEHIEKQMKHFEKNGTFGEKLFGIFENFSFFCILAFTLVFALFFVAWTLLEYGTFSEKSGYFSKKPGHF